MLTIDSEEFVIEKVLNALASLTELGLFQKSSILELSKTIVKLVVHPNIWVANGAVGFLATTAKSVGSVDAQALLYPVIRTYLLCDISTISEQKLLDFKQKPVWSAALHADVRFRGLYMMHRLLGLLRLNERITGNHSRSNRVAIFQ
jgi:sorbitol-specific phosphotransferase system component IIC